MGVVMETMVVGNAVVGTTGKVGVVAGTMVSRAGASMAMDAEMGMMAVVVVAAEAEICVGVGTVTSVCVGLAPVGAQMDVTAVAETDVVVGLETEMVAVVDLKVETVSMVSGEIQAGTDVRSITSACVAVSAGWSAARNCRGRIRGKCSCRVSDGCGFDGGWCE